MAWFPVLIIPLMILSLSTTPTNSELLLGDALFAGDPPSSSGMLLHGSPLNFTSSLHFTAGFIFKLRSGIALVILPAAKFVTNIPFSATNASRLLGIEFYPNMVQISSAGATTVSKVDNILKHGVNLWSLILYDPISKRLEVRVNELGHPRTVEPLISYKVDLGELLKGGNVSVGLVFCNKSYEEVLYVYSWHYGVMDVKHWWGFYINPFGPWYNAKKKASVASVFFWSTFAIACVAFVIWIKLFAWPYVVNWKGVQVKDPETAMK